MKELTLTSFDGFRIAASWYPVKDPKGALLMIHGALEHKERYEPLTRILNEHDYAVLISDNRGHGHSVSDEYPPGYMDGVEKVIKDQECLLAYLKQQVSPDTPLYLFGHSLGSLFARIFLQEHDHEFRGLILSGTACYHDALPFGMLMGKICTLVTGKHGYSRLLNILSPLPSDPYKWVSYSHKNIENMAKDPLCYKAFQNEGLMTVMEADFELKKYRKYQCKNPGLRILSVSGKDDPVPGGVRGLRDTVRTLKRIGYRDIKVIEYPGMMHEILNEEDPSPVYRDILAFLEQ